MPTDLVFPIQVVLAFVTMGLLARWYVAPRLAGLPREIALQPLLAVQTVRYIGLGFLAPALVRPSLAQTFAVPAALGTLKDPAAKYYLALRLSLPRKVGMIIAANPSTLDTEAARKQIATILTITTELELQLSRV